MPATAIKEKAPASACRLAGGAVTFAAAADRTTKAVPVKMMARSADPIVHWFWGPIVHDMAGMKLHKPVLPCDYMHDAPIGYLDKFMPSNRGLLVEGALVPTGRPDDPVKSLVELSDGGVPFEASIFFDEDMKAEFINEGQTARVNGYDFDGPGVVIREWWLRGVAVCPYGADMNTSSAFAARDKRMFSIIAVPHVPRGFASRIRFAGRGLNVFGRRSHPPVTGEPKGPEYMGRRLSNPVAFAEAADGEGVEVERDNSDLRGFAGKIRFASHS